MKQTFVVEIILPDLPNAGFSECEIERALAEWRRKSFSESDVESFTFIARQQFAKPLKTNDLPRKQLVIHHTEDKGLHALRLQGIAWDRQTVGDEEDNVFNDIWDTRLDR